MKFIKQIFGWKKKTTISPPLKEMRELTQYILSVRDLKDIGHLGEHAVQQLADLNENYRKFEERLHSRFGTDPKAFEEYRWPAEKVYMSVIDHLHGVALSLHSVSAIDSQKEERKAVREKQVQLIQSTLTFNDTAITDLRRISEALLVGNSPNLRVELVTLAKRAKDYSMTEQLSK